MDTLNYKDHFSQYGVRRSHLVDNASGPSDAMLDHYESNMSLSEAHRFTDGYVPAEEADLKMYGMAPSYDEVAYDEPSPHWDPENLLPDDMDAVVQYVRPDINAYKASLERSDLIITGATILMGFVLASILSK